MATVLPFIGIFLLVNTCAGAAIPPMNFTRAESNSPVTASSANNIAPPTWQPHAVPQEQHMSSSPMKEIIQENMIGNLFFHLNGNAPNQWNLSAVFSTNVEEIDPGHTSSTNRKSGRALNSFDGMFCENRTYPTIRLDPDSFVRIFSPNYPQNYPNNFKCGWKLLAEEGNRIRVLCPIFNLRDDDSVYVKDMALKSILRYHENRPMRNVTSATNQMFVGLISNTAGSGSGFDCYVRPLPTLAPVADGVQVNAEANANADIRTNATISESATTKINETTQGNLTEIIDDSVRLLKRVGEALNELGSDATLESSQTNQEVTNWSSALTPPLNSILSTSNMAAKSTNMGTTNPSRYSSHPVLPPSDQTSSSSPSLLPVLSSDLSNNSTRQSNLVPAFESSDTMSRSINSSLTSSVSSPLNSSTDETTIITSLNVPHWLQNLITHTADQPVIISAPRSVHKGITTYTVRSRP